MMKINENPRRTDMRTEKPKRGGQGKTVDPAHPFLAATAADSMHSGGFRYHEVNRVGIEQ